MKGLLKQATAEADVLRAKEKNYNDLENEFQMYKDEHGNSGVNSLEGDILTQTKGMRELEESHAKEIAALREDYETQLEELEKRLKHRMEEEMSRLTHESQKELDKLAKVKDKEVEMFKESVERRRRRTSEFVSAVEHEQLRVKLDEITKELEKENSRQVNLVTNRSSPTKLQPSGSERQVRTELAEMKKELIKKANAADKATLELEKLRSQMQTSQSVSETKISLLKSKIKNLETKLVQKNPAVSTPTTTDPSTPVAGGSGPGTRFHRTDVRTVAKTVAGPPRFSTFSTTPYLQRTVRKPEKSLGLLTPSGLRAASSTGSPRMVSRISTPIIRQSSPLRRTLAISTPTQRSSLLRFSPRRTTLAESSQPIDGALDSTTLEKAAPSTAISKASGLKVSLFDEDEVEPTSKKESVKEGGEVTAVDGEEPRRKGKRKLNAAKVDIYDSGDDENHPDIPGSVFKRVKLSGSPVSQLNKSSKSAAASKLGAVRDTGNKAPAGQDFSRSGMAPAKSDVPRSVTKTPVAATPKVGGRPLLGHDISPLKARNKGVRPTFKV